MIPDQSILLEKAAFYFESKALKTGVDTPEIIAEDLCSGLVGYWLYLSRIGHQDKFASRLRYLATWDNKLFKATTLKRDEEIEQLLDNLQLLAYPEKLLPTSRQYQLATSFALGSDEKDQKIGEAEFSLTFIFDQKSLADVLERLAQPNKMFRLSNGFHIIGLMLVDGQYQVYDPNSKNGVLETNSLLEVAAYIFGGFEDLQDKQPFLSLNISIYDLQGCSPGTYFDPTEYYSEKLADPDCRKIMMHHTYLFYLAAKYNEYVLINLMFANGYKYRMWRGNKLNEVNECIKYHDIPKLKFLLEQGLPVNATSIEYALERDVPEAIILLLSAGVTLQQAHKDAIANKYGSQGAMLIYEYALAMLSKVLHLEMLDENVVARLGFYEQQLIRYINDLTHAIQLPKVDWQKLQGDAVEIARQIDQTGKIEPATVPTAQLIVENLRIAAFEHGVDVSDRCEKAMGRIDGYIQKMQFSDHVLHPNSLFFSSQSHGSLAQSEVYPVLENYRAKLKA